jgi:hypothetical protein
MQYVMKPRCLFHSVFFIFLSKVRTYVQCLKECLVPPDDPGPMWEALHHPDQEIDMTIYDKERARLQKIKEDRARIE